MGKFLPPLESYLQGVKYVNERRTSVDSKSVADYSIKSGPALDSVVATDIEGQCKARSQTEILQCRHSS